MINKNMLSKENGQFLFAITTGTLVGLITIVICIHLNLTIIGINIHIFIAPIIAGFIETFISRKLTNKSSGAISAIILFIITNFIGWFFPAQPITWNIFTLGGLLFMLQAAIPLTINYILIAILLGITYLFGIIGGYIAVLLNKNNAPQLLCISEIDSVNSSDILVLNNSPEIPIKEYHNLVYAEQVIRFDNKPSELVKYAGSKLNEKRRLQHNDYIKAKNYIINEIKKEALSINANAIIDIEIEYTNFNQQLPPDMLIAAYGTAVTIDKKYLN
ncbi:heavy metal-binding domain-containing protein [Methanosphaera sp. WGK6]|uniref:heavy metal-binding domain-containing protein n=1 Tax=Methanosphaera sp. WGK6 TaxID=1561964 RepID=UPI00084CAAE1|nr:heavy metal-binding domain-containing protein [Methanosphaera sp. WGK6]